MGRQGGTEDKLGMTLDDVIRVQVPWVQSVPWESLGIGAPSDSDVFYSGDWNMIYSDL